MMKKDDLEFIAWDRQHARPRGAQEETEKEGRRGASKWFRFLAVVAVIAAVVLIRLLLSRG